MQLSKRYIGDRFLPDKAIDLMDEAASQVRMTAEASSPDLKALEERSPPCIGRRPRPWRRRTSRRPPSCGTSEELSGAGGDRA